jgi:hypothetical protein
LRGHHSLQLSPTTTENHDTENNKVLPDRLSIHATKSQGKSASVDAIPNKFAENRTSSSTDKIAIVGEAGEDTKKSALSALIPPYQRVSRILSKGRMFRPNKVAPAPRLEETITVSPVIQVDTSPCHSVCGYHQRNNVCDHGRVMKGDTCVTVHHNISDESMENICRICHDSPSSEKLITPCMCKGINIKPIDASQEFEGAANLEFLG